MGEAHIGHEWDSTKDSSSEEDKKIATMAIHKPSSTPRLFNNIFDDDYYSRHIFPMEKVEKVKPKSKPPPPSDTSSGDTSDYYSDGVSSDEEIGNITKNLNSKTKLFITKLMEDLESVQAKLEFREETLIKQDNLYIASKEALALERSEVESLCKALDKEKEAHAITKKANIALNKKYCDLDRKHKQLEEQYSILWDSNSHPSEAKDASIPSTSQGCGKYYNLDLNAYSTNLANMEAMRKEINRLNEVIGKSFLGGKTQVSDRKAKDPKAKEPQFKQGRHPSIKHGLGHTIGAKTKGRKIINGSECVEFKRKGQNRCRAVCIDCDSIASLSGSAMEWQYYGEGR